MYYLSLRPMYYSSFVTVELYHLTFWGPLYKITDTCANLIFKFYPYYSLYLCSDFHHIIMIYNARPPEFPPNFVIFLHTLP